MTKRIHYIDGLKALSIFLVVYAHVIYNSYNCAPITSIHKVFINFCDALFFFLSGLFAYKQIIIKEDLCNAINKKFTQLIIPTIIFGSLYSYCCKQGIVGLLYAPLKNGYWFTFVLFIFYTIHLLITFATQKLRNKYRWYIYTISAITIYALSIYAQKHPSTLFNVLSIPLWNYYLYFLLGIFCKYKSDSLSKLIDGRIFPTVIVFCFFLFVLFRKEIQTAISFPLEGTLIQVTYSSACILIIYMLFRKHTNWFDNEEHFVTKCVNTTGKRTLDIYMIHYFFIPGCLDGVAKFLLKSDSVVIDFMVTSLIVIGIIFFSLLISELLRLSPILSNILLGVKKKGR